MHYTFSSVYNKQTLLENAVIYANQHHYSKPMLLSNYGYLLSPITPVKIKEGITVPVRIAHGILHAVAAMDSIDGIIEEYRQQKICSADQMEKINTSFNFETDTAGLIELLKIACVFHDSARLNDGKDLWDRQSAINCFIFLMRANELAVSDIDTLFEQDDDVMCLSEERFETILAKFDSDEKKSKFKQALLAAKLIQYKDDRAGFYLFCHKYFGMDAHKANEADFIRQFINMADTMEVIRCRDKFDLIYTPIYKNFEAKCFARETEDTKKELAEKLSRDQENFSEEEKEKILSDFEAERRSRTKRSPFPKHSTDNHPLLEKTKAMVERLIIPHRTRIRDEGRQRLFSAGNIVCRGESLDESWPAPAREDSVWERLSSQGFHEENVAKKTKAVFEKYDLSVIKEGRIDVEKAAQSTIAALNNYLQQHKRVSFSLRHHGMFSPRFHGETGRTRAMRFIELLEKAKAHKDRGGEDYSSLILYAMLSSNKGQTLQEEVLDFMGSVDKQPIVDALNEDIQQNHCQGGKSNFIQSLGVRALALNFRNYAEGESSEDFESLLTDRKRIQGII